MRSSEMRKKHLTLDQSSLSSGLNKVFSINVASLSLKENNNTCPVVSMDCLCKSIGQCFFFFLMLVVLATHQELNLG